MLYGAKIGLEKSCPETKKRGIHKPVKIFAKKRSHYSKFIVANWLGIGVENVVEIPETSTGIDIPLFKNMLLSVINENYRVGTIFLEAGSTYEFLMDDIKQVVELRDQLASENMLEYLPHIHVDAVLGWIFSVFCDYNFKINNLGFAQKICDVLQKTTSFVQNLNMADSVGIDFHKLGYAPLTSSCVLVKDKNDLQIIRSLGDIYSDYATIMDYRPGEYSLECSRSSSGVISAYANCRLLGKNGFRTLLAYSMELIVEAVDLIRSIENCLLLNENILGPAIVFRFYPFDFHAIDAYQNEISGLRPDQEVEIVNQMNRNIYEQYNNLVSLKSIGMISFLECFQEVKTTGFNISAFKLFIISPFTTKDIVTNTFVTLSELAREQSIRMRDRI
jgi:L-2,4-diaminobutyrate decarboxylase